MVKKRVHELAKEFTIENKEVIRRLSLLGIIVKSHVSTVDEKDVERLREELKKEREKKAFHEAARSPADEVKNENGDILQKEQQNKQRYFEQGSDIVNRVPSRPPDRRFQKRPFLKGDILHGKVGQQPVQQSPPSSEENRRQSTENVVPLEPVQRPEPVKPDPGRSFSDHSVRGAGAAGRTELPRGPVNKPGVQKAVATGKSLSDRQGRDQKEQFAKKPEQLKVPKVPEEVKAQERVRADKSRGEKPKQAVVDRATGKGRSWWNGEDHSAEHKMRSAIGGRQKKGQTAFKAFNGPPIAVEKKPVVIRETVSVQELSAKMKKSPTEVIKKLISLGVMATINEMIDNETATIVAGEFGFEVQVKIELDQEAMLEQEETDSSQFILRPCVVTIMGHVDHGKTSLLDAIRETNVTANEFGGITQHIGAYQVEYNNKKITFIDTPGHEAFTAMRARGAQVTDIAVLVISADDGIMPQTIEAISHSKAAGVPVIIAINKIDKPGANVEKVKQQLTDYELVPEEWGGDIICVSVSAKTGQGISELLEMILLVAEVNDLRTNPNRSARGTIIEAKLDKGRGPVATVLIQSGTLHIGDNVIAGTASGRVRAMMDYRGRRLKSAGPSTPAEVLGFSDVPQAGDTLYVVEEEKMARQIAAKRILRKREEDIKTSIPKVSLDDLFKQIKEGQVKELNIIIKADVQGSVEALKQSLESLSTEEVKVNTIHSGVGLISETDILLASASSAIIVGFNVRTDVNARRVAELEKVDIRLYKVIYDAINDMKAAMSGLLEPEYKEVTIGRAEVRKTFKVSRLGTIAGCYVTEGKIARDAKVRLVRGEQIIYEGKLDSLKRFKDDVREVLQGYECGLALDKFNELKEGDIVEAFATETIKRELV